MKHMTRGPSVPDMYRRTACGRWVPDVRATDDLDEVSCRRCTGTWDFRRATALGAWYRDDVVNPNERLAQIREASP